MLLYSASFLVLSIFGLVRGRSTPEVSPIIVLKVLDSSPVIREHETPSICGAFNNIEDEEEPKILSPPMNSEDEELLSQLKMENLRLKDLANTLKNVQRVKDSGLDEPFQKLLPPRSPEDMIRSRLFERPGFRPLPISFAPPPIYNLPEFPPKHLDLRGYFVRRQFAALRKFMKNVIENIEDKKGVFLK